MPLNIDFVQILLHLLNFVLLFGGLTLLLYRPIVRFTEKRRQHFEALEEEQRVKAVELETAKAEYEKKEQAFESEMRERRLEAEKEAAETAKSYIESSKAEAAAILARAEKDAEKRKGQILDAAQTEIGEMVIGAAQKLLGDTATPERTQELYDEFLRQSGAGEETDE